VVTTEAFPLHLVAEDKGCRMMDGLGHSSSYAAAGIAQAIGLEAECPEDGLKEV
jgi:hypothetical protein